MCTVSVPQAVLTHACCEGVFCEYLLLKSSQLLVATCCMYPVWVRRPEGQSGHGVCIRISIPKEKLTYVLLSSVYRQRNSIGGKLENYNLHLHHDLPFRFRFFYISLQAMTSHFVAVPAFNPSTQEVDQPGLQSSRIARATQRNPVSKRKKKKSLS